MISTFTAPTRVVAGLGSLTRLGDELTGLGADRIAVVADQGVADAGVLDRVLDAVGAPAACTVLVRPNPAVADAEAAATEARGTRCEVVLAVGGGSALGLAKAVAIRLTNDDPITAYEGSGRVPHRPAQSVAVPTTAGSGSEVSNALVLHEPGRSREIVVRGPGCEPRVAILDGTLLTGLPAAPMTYAALDALTHALEALWARGRSSFTDALARAAATTIADTLAAALTNREPELLQRLLEASCAANLACGNTGLGLVHALSSAPSVPLPHGLQNGVLLPHVARFNAGHVAPEFRDVLDRVDQLYSAIGFTPRFDANALPPYAAEAMITASDGHPFRINNIRESSDEQLRELLQNAGLDGAAVR